MTETIEEPGLVVALYGDHCPVQAEGTVDGTAFYFRSRGQRWTMNIGERVHSRPEWRYVEAYGDEPYAAGWISGEEAIGFIKKAAGLYRSRAPSTRGSMVVASAMSPRGAAGGTVAGPSTEAAPPALPLGHAR